MVTASRVIAVLGLSLAVGCGKPTGVPQPSPDSVQKLPFDRESRPNGISPSQSLIPPTKRLVEGTSVSIRLRTTLSSATAHAGDGFEGVLDEPVAVDAQPLISAGAAVVGRVLDAHRSSGDHNPGYLRIALVSVNVAGKTILLDTSSIFAKGSSRDAHAHAGTGGRARDIAFTADRRLTFHLTEDTDLP
jgi:hypothetical protein